MKIFKRIGIIALLAFLTISLVGCGKEEKKEENTEKVVEKNVEGTLEDIMAKLYDGIADEDKPMMLGNIELNEENIEGFVGTSDIEYKEAIASESMVGSIAHSVVLLRTKDGANVEDVKKKIKDNVNPRKWICVGVEPDDVIVKSKGDLVVLILIENATIRETIDKNFNEL